MLHDYNAEAAQNVIAGLQSGLNFLLTSKLKKQDSEDQLTRDAGQLQGQKELQNAALLAHAKDLFDTQNFQATQADKDRTWKTGERVGSQDFTVDRDFGNNLMASVRAGEDRDFQAQQAAKMLAQQKMLADAQQMQQNNQFNQTFGLQRTAQDWAQSPDNPANISREAYAKRLLSQAGDFGDPAATPDSAAPSQFGSIYEGKLVIGPDGKKYLIKNGQPVAP